MGEAGAEFCHFVYFVDAFSGNVVEAVEVGFVNRDTDFVVALGYRKNCLEDCALAVLNPLAHRVKVGSEVYRSGENAFVVLAFAFAVELFPPFCEEVKFGIEVYKDFDFLACTVEGVAGHGICKSHVAVAVEGSFCHSGSTFYESVDVVSCNCNGQKAYGSKHREAAADIVGDNVCLVAFGIGKCTQSATGSVGDSDDAFASFFTAKLFLELFAQDAESDSGLGCCA